MIELVNIEKVYGTGPVKVKALESITMTVSKGEFVGILGPSGSGKSTLMNILGCLDPPTAGEYYLEGRKVSGMNDDELADIRSKKIGFIFQKFNLLPKFTAVQNVEIPLLYRGEKRDTAREKAKELLRMVGLFDRMHHRPNELSGGQQQRVAIARALVGNPQIILADEPTGNLDTKSGSEVLELFLKLNSMGNTILLITHDTAVAKLAGRVIHIQDGKILKDEKILSLG
ncbi:MAG: ABC-type antimicrobial peptide transport system, ATPase component [Firmicutes bacterium]|nr:ABC-type antimicrobial peptide transport system, ATPase component [Bacillota bacterium]MDI6705652.1 ABC transporter ATP-binding protein [Bacillota bacterium]